MDRVETAALAFRLAGLYAVVQAILLVPTLALPLRNAVRGSPVEHAVARAQDDRWTELLLVAGPIVLAMALLVLLAFVLLAFGRHFAERTIAAPSQVAIDFGGEAESRQVVAFTLFGLWLLCLSVPELLSQAASIVALGESAWTQWRGRIPELAAPVAQLALGLWLLLAPRSAQGLWAFLARVRQAP